MSSNNTSRTISALDRWTSQGAVQNSKRTYHSVQSAINNERYGLGSENFDHSYDIHLQGSYANNTNTYGESDVDIVVRLTMPFHQDLSALDSREVDRFWQKYHDINYSFWDFYQKVWQTLKRYYGRENIVKGDKAIKIKSNDNTPLPLEADVVACTDYRKYRSFSSQSENYTTGMFFREQTTGRQIVNYSKEHRKNGKIKNEKTNNRYKPTIRMFKNARYMMEQEGILRADTASSYYIEGLLYNVPNQIIEQSDLQDRYTDIIDWLETADVSKFKEQSEMYPLCADADPDRWTKSDADATIDGFRKLLEI